MDDVAFSAWLDRGVQAWGGWIVLAAVVWFYGGKALAWLRLPSLGAVASFVGLLVSNLFPRQPAAIMSHSRPSEPSEPSRPEDGREIAPPTPVIFAPTHAQTFDAAKLLRAYGLNREQAREVLKAVGGALPNDMWTQVAPPPTEGQTVTPIVGRVTKAEFRETEPGLVYQPPQ